MKRAICAGHVCIDITPLLPDTGAVRISDALAPGKLVEAGKAVISAGGSVSNTGLCMRRLGADVVLMGKAGSDCFGDMLERIFEEHGAGGGLIRSSDAATSYSVILAVPGIDRIFLHHPGANQCFYADDVPWDRANGAALFHFGYPSVMRSMYINNGDELLKLLRRAKSAGMATSLDMSAVDPDSEAGKIDWKPILKRVLPEVDFFVPSAEELCAMLDRDRLNDWYDRAKGTDVCGVLDPEADIRPLARMCVEMGAGVVLLKCGAPGMYLYTADAARLRAVSEKLCLNAELWARQDFFEPSYAADRVVSATGAGDTSIAGFLTSILNGDDPQKAVRLAAAVGACCVTEADSLSGIPSLETIEQRIENGWRKNALRLRP